jgi:ubiquitin carboxyl-terminal hydrolase 4/11/15
MEWHKPNYKLYYNKSNENDYDIHPSLNTSSNDENSEISLNDCLMAFTKQEQLGPDDPWYCNDCKEFRQAFKKFDIWCAPPILIIHLKRFSYRGRFSFREKLDNLISFPLTDLDLSQFIIGPKPVPPIYDLYAISNHFGSLGGGHYTAYCKHRDDGQWYLYDDSSVRPVPASQVSSSAAYVLFYHRKDIPWPAFDRTLDRLVPEEEEGSDTEEDSGPDNSDNPDAGNPEKSPRSSENLRNPSYGNPFENITSAEDPEPRGMIHAHPYFPPAGFEQSEEIRLADRSIITSSNPIAGEEPQNKPDSEDTERQTEQPSTSADHPAPAQTPEDNRETQLPAGREIPQDLDIHL